jgi:hypothetical protein
MFVRGLAAQGKRPEPALVRCGDTTAVHDSFRPMRFKRLTKAATKHGAERSRVFAVLHSHRAPSLQAQRPAGRGAEFKRLCQATSLYADRLKGSEDKCAFKLVYHITHLREPVRILEDKIITGQLVPPGSRLSRSRVQVSWAIPNQYPDSYFGHFRLSLDWECLSDGARFYWIEQPTGRSGCNNVTS